MTLSKEANNYGHLSFELLRGGKFSMMYTEFQGENESLLLEGLLILEIFSH